MPTGSNGQKRPADAVGCAVKVAKIATGEIIDEAHTERQELARKGGKARADKLSARAPTGNRQEQRQGTLGW